MTLHLETGMIVNRGLLALTSLAPWILFLVGNSGEFSETMAVVLLLSNGVALTLFVLLLKPIAPLVGIRWGLMWGALWLTFFSGFLLLMSLLFFPPLLASGTLSSLFSNILIQIVGQGASIARQISHGKGWRR